MTVKTNEAKIKCWGCRKTVTLEFHRVHTPDRRHWEGICECGTKNYIYRPSWDQLPIFRKYTREYLSEVTGYSKGYLCRIAREKEPLGQVFVDRCCFTLQESQKKLFGQ